MKVSGEKGEVWLVKACGCFWDSLSESGITDKVLAQSSVAFAVDCIEFIIIIVVFIVFVCLFVLFVFWHTYTFCNTI